MLITIFQDIAARHVMKEAAVLAGMEDNSVSIALEPEAASIWCLKNQLEVYPVSSVLFSSRVPGSIPTEDNFFFSLFFLFLFFSFSKVISRCQAYTNTRLWSLMLVVAQWTSPFTR